MTTRPSYKAAIAEHRTAGKIADNDSVETAIQVVMENLELYDATAKAAKQDGAQMIVYPEWGLFGTIRSSSWFQLYQTPASSRDCMKLFAQSIPENKTDLLSVGDEASIVRGLAEIAKKHEIVLVANVCEKCDGEKSDDNKMYNTEVAIDETGKLMAKYHKMHPWFPETFDTPSEQVVTFEASWGVTFGLFICYDLRHEQPQKSLLKKEVVHFPYSFATPDSFIVRWYLKLWAWKKGAVLLASNLGGGGTIVGPYGSVTNVERKETHVVATINL